ASTRAPDRTGVQRGVAAPPRATRRFSDKFSRRSFSRLEFAPRRGRRDAGRARSVLGCECEAAHERDALSTRLGELAMTEMENDNLRAQVDDLQRAVESVRRQAQDEVDTLVLEMHVLRKRYTFEHGEHFEYSDDDHDVLHDEHTMGSLRLGEGALHSSDIRW
ncbi:unnamed protein product, partial [Agarophyton chilense]